MAWYDNQIIDSSGALLGYDCACCDCYAPPPSISLDQFFDVLCVNPFYGWQMAQKPANYPGTPIPGSFKGKLCDQVVYERCVNGCKVAGREEICDAIREADQRFVDFAGFWPVPTEACTEFAFPCGFLAGNLQLEHNKLLALGRIVESELGSIAITDADFVDTNGDGVLDIVQLEISRFADTVHSKDEIIAKRTQDDCSGGPCGDELRPICIKEHPTDDALYLLEIPVWLLVEKSNYNWLDPQPLDPNDLTIYIREIVLYRRFVDGTKAVSIMRNPNVGKCSCSRTEGCYECDTASACIVSAESGIVRIDLTDGGCGCFCSKCAHRICIHYVSGECTGRWEPWIARLAASFLGRPICCQPLGDLVSYWSADFIQTDSRGRISTPLSQGEQASSFGTKRAAVELHRLLRRQRRMVIGTI